jgi:Ca-activated chloride channel family protein
MLWFANPVFLLLNLLVPLVCWWWLRRRRSALRFPDTGWLVELPAGRKVWATRCGAVMRGTALALLVIALAGPRWPDRSSRIPTEGIAIQMVVDVSPSMRERDFDWYGLSLSRLEAAHKALSLFVVGNANPENASEPRFEGRPNDLIGLVTFSDRPDVTCPLTLSHAVLLQLLADLFSENRTPPISETNISDALVLGLHRLKEARPQRKVLVLLSDGEHNYLAPRSEWTPRQAAQIAANLSIPIYAIDAGGDPETAAEPATLREQGIRTLRDVARITGGQYFQARDADALLAVYRDLDQREREEIESFQYRRYHEGFRWFALAAFVLFVSACVLDRTVWLRVP